MKSYWLAFFARLSMKQNTERKTFDTQNKETQWSKTGRLYVALFWRVFDVCLLLTLFHTGNFQAQEGGKYSGRSDKSKANWPGCVHNKKMYVPARPQILILIERFQIVNAGGNKQSSTPAENVRKLESSASIEDEGEKLTRTYALKICLQS